MLVAILILFLLKNGYSVTNLGKNVKLIYEDESLNSPVDVLYLDLGRNKKFHNYLDKSIDDNTVTILRYSIPVIDAMIPDFIKRKYPNYRNDYLKFGNWDDKYVYNNSEYFLMFF